MRRLVLNLLRHRSFAARPRLIQDVWPNALFPFMNRLEEIKKNRFKYLNRLHDVTEGSSYKHVSMWNLGNELGFNKGETSNIVEYLVGERLAKHVAIGGEITITHDGRKEIESALSAPEKPTTYFPPVVNILHVQSMVGSQIQQGTRDSTQKMSVSQNQLDSVRDFVALFRTRLPDIPLDGDSKAEADAEIATVEAQLQSSRPKHGILTQSLQSIRTILEGAAGNVVASDLLPKLIQAITTLSP